MYGPALVLAGVDHADDVRVRELGHGARLAPEALELVGVGRDLAVHQLDRDLALERLVERPVDGRHAAGADPGLQPVAAAERRSEQRAHLSPYFAARHGRSPAARADPFGVPRGAASDRRSPLASRWSPSERQR